MNNKTQKIILIVAFLLPILVFIFLKKFGSNEFAVAPLFQKGTVESSCGGVIVMPYTLPDSILTERNNESKLLLCVFGVSESNYDLGREVRRIDDQFSDQQLQILKEGQDSRECYFLMGDSTNIALVDRRNTIRGLYDGNSRDDVDRLMAEVEIILKFDNE